MSEAADEAGAHAPDAPAPIVVDVNEPPRMAALLAARGMSVERRRLAPADYVVGPVGIERKTVGDFHRSMIDGRLFEQLVRLKDAYPAAALLLEGDAAFFAARQSPRSSWGALLSIALDLDVAIVPSPSTEASAEILAVLAARIGRSAFAGGGAPEVRYKPRLLGPHAEQKFVVQGMPGIGDVVSETLLDHFGSLRRLFAASERELRRAPGVGTTRARQMTELLDRPFVARQRRLPREE